MSAIEARDLHFSYGERYVLRGVSFSAEPGELIALLGPNGAGKSTLMRCLLGLTKDYRGAVYIAGEDIRTMSRTALAGKVAYIPQSAPTVFNYTVLDTVLMGVTGRIGLLGAPDAACEAKAMETLESLGVGHLAKRGCGELSGGERQLVLLARALVQDARVLIMDEPTANLDYGNQNRVMQRVLQLVKEGYTVLFSTHDPNQALLYASRALTLWEGRMLTDAAPEQALTENVLETIYGISVRRCLLPDEDMSICVPRRSVVSGK